MSKRIHFEDYAAPTSYGDPIEFGFEAEHMRIIHDGNGTLTISFDKTATDGKMLSTDTPLELLDLRMSKIWIKSSVDTDPVRVYAWRSGR